MQKEIQEDIKMKIINSMAIAITVVSGLWISSVSENQAYAVSGCCKQRSSVNDAWYRVGSDLNACKNLNAAEGDNIFHPTGKVWWDVAC